MRRKICPLGLEQFAALVESDVRGLMEQEWKETAMLTPYQRDQRGQWDYAGQKAGSSAPGEFCL